MADRPTLAGGGEQARGPVHELTAGRAGRHRRVGGIDHDLDAGERLLEALAGAQVDGSELQRAVDGRRTPGYDDFVAARRQLGHYCRTEQAAAAQNHDLHSRILGFGSAVSGRRCRTRPGASRP